MKVPSFREYKRINEVLGYTAITNDVIMCEDGRLIALFELVISYLDLEEIMQNRHDRFNKLLCDLPGDSSVSVYMTKIIYMPELKVRNDHDLPIINYIEQKRKEKICSESVPLFRCYMSLTMRAQEKNKKSPVEPTQFVALKKKQDNFCKGLVASLDGSVLRLDSSQIGTFIGHLLNHNDARSSTKISDIFESDFNSSVNGKKKYGFVYYGGNYHAVLGLRPYGSDSKLPEFTWGSMNNIWHHPDLKNVEFTIQHQTVYPRKDDALAVAYRRKNMISGRQAVAKNFNMKWLEKSPEGINLQDLKEDVEAAILNVETAGERFVNWQYRLHLWAPTLEELEGKVEDVMAVVGTTHKFLTEKWNVKAAFFSLMPGCETMDNMQIMVPSYNAADYLPIDLPRTAFDDGESGTYLHYYAESGEMTRFDLFDKRATVWNGIVCGGSGSGKSFLVNDFLYQFMQEYKGQVAICDYGGAEAGSYRNLVANTGGTYLEINFDNTEFSINPFEGKLFNEGQSKGDEGEINAIKFTSLMATLERMLISEGQKDNLSGEERFELQTLLRRYYEDTKNNLNGTNNLNEFAQKYLKQHMEHLYKKIFMFIGEGKEGGPYARFFRGKKEITNKEIVCFDMAGLKGHEVLKNVLVPALLDMICNDVLASDKDRKKMLVMDEAWQDLSRGGQMQDFIEEMYRTIRKLGGSCYVITQRFEDVLSSNIGGALVANTSYFYFVGNRHNPESLYRAEAGSAQGSMHLSEYDVESILGSRMKSDFYMLCPYFCGKLTFKPTKEFCVVATTDPDDKVKIRKWMRHFEVNFATPEVIEAVKGEL